MFRLEIKQWFVTHLDNGSDELQQEARHNKQGGEVVVKEVHDEPLDVAPILILICHDHDVAVP